MWQPKKLGIGPIRGHIRDMKRPLGPKERQIMNFLRDRVFAAVLQSKSASAGLKSGVRLTMLRMEDRNAAGMVNYFWKAIRGTERSVGFAKKMEREGFDRFEEALEEFRDRFDDRFLRQP
ncbi:MAG TPA: hypothetical protein VGH70_07050 [Bradyrhizobium sp.]|jgi:hypothetical protein